MSPIDILIDDKACVGCTLCVDVCPTHVLEMNTQENIPRVSKVKECFGCLSCSEICPATAITHTNVSLSESYYHDPESLDLAAKLGTSNHSYNVPTDTSHLKAAIEDLQIRLLSVASVLKQTLGQSLPSIGTMAGISLASQLPRYQVPQSREEALDLLVKIFSPAWVLQPSLNNDELSVTVTTCFVRDICLKSKIALGGDLCTLFYNYYAGYFSKIAKVRPRLTSVKQGNDSCVYAIKLYEQSN